MAGMSHIKNFDKLRPMPIAAARVMSMLAEDEPDLQKIAEILRMDEALSFAILRLANSAKFGVPGREFNLREATIRLGAREISKLVVCQQLGDSLGVAVEAFELDRGALWRSALGGAFAAEELAKKHQQSTPELVFICALLRDIGKLVLDAAYGSKYDQQVSQDLEGSMAYDEAEKSAFGADHAEVGAALAEHWGLPSAIVSTIRRHHNPAPPESDEHSEVCDFVHAADIITLWSGLAIGADGLQYKLAPHVRSRILPDRAVAEGTIVTMWTRLQEAEDMLAPAQQGRQIA